mgnify:CR=1 FL=1
MSKRGGYGKLYGYVGKEYFLSFLVAFVFFFFIFFVNQILVLAQKILLKNVMLSDVLMLVVLSIPQFLMYTMPFSSLASASMVIGNLSSQNEVLALRSCGIHTGRIFVPIVGISLLLSISTLFIADRMIPYTTERYRDLYAQVLERVPTLELESYSSTTFGNMVISNGLVDKNEVHDMLIFDDSDPNNSRVVFADKGSFSVVDIDRFIYRIDMENPQILATDSTSLESYSLAKASSMTMYINLSSQTGANVNITPSQMSIRQLMTLTNERREENDSLKAQKAEDLFPVLQDGASEKDRTFVCMYVPGVHCFSNIVLQSQERASSWLWAFHAHCMHVLVPFVLHAYKSHNDVPASCNLHLVPRCTCVLHRGCPSTETS